MSSGDAAMGRRAELPHADDDLRMLERTWADPRGAYE
jgi:hypothetical protein